MQLTLHQGEVDFSEFDFAIDTSVLNVFIRPWFEQMVRLAISDTPPAIGIDANGTIDIDLEFAGSGLSYPIALSDLIDDAMGSGFLEDADDHRSLAKQLRELADKLDAAAAGAVPAEAA